MNGTPPGPQAEVSDIAAKLTIVQKKNGEVLIEGPIDNLLMCYGLIECGRDALRFYNQNKQAQDPTPALQIARRLPGH